MPSFFSSSCCRGLLLLFLILGCERSAQAGPPVTIEVQRSCFCEALDNNGNAINEFKNRSTHHVPINVYLRLSLNEACYNYLESTRYLKLQIVMKRAGDFGARLLDLTIEPAQWAHERSKALLEIKGDEQPGYFHWRWPVGYSDLPPGDYTFFITTDGNQLNWVHGAPFQNKITIKD